MKNRKKHTNHAVAGVIEALLLVGLVAIVISMIQLQYIPMVMEQREADHMDQVSNQFSTLKSFIEMQSITQATSPFSTLLTLSSEPLPYFITAGSYGSVSVEESIGQIRVIHSIAGIYDYPLTSIKYEASNVYFVPQNYILEAGGIVVQQPDGSPVMRVDPSIRVENHSNEIRIHFNLPVFNGIAGKNMTSGVGKCYIRTNWSEGNYEQIESGGEIESITFTTSYPSAWYEALHLMLEENVEYELNESYVKINKKQKTISLDIIAYDIYVQVGIGWIK
jgi:hypothetical protein